MARSKLQLNKRKKAPRRKRENNLRTSGAVSFSLSMDCDYVAGEDRIPSGPCCTPHEIKHVQPGLHFLSLL